MVAIVGLANHQWLSCAVPPDPWILYCLSPKELAMHLGFDLCAEEKAFLSRRKQLVAKALKQALQLDRDLQEDEVWGYRGCGCDTLE